MWRKFKVGDRLLHDNGTTVVEIVRIYDVLPNEPPGFQVKIVEGENKGYQYTMSYVTALELLVYTLEKELREGVWIQVDERVRQVIPHKNFDARDMTTADHFRYINGQWERVDHE